MRVGPASQSFPRQGKKGDRIMRFSFKIYIKDGKYQDSK